LSERSVPEGAGSNGDAPDGIPNGPPVATPAFCEAVAGDLGIKVSAARTAFLNEPTQRVLGVVGWAMDRSEDPEERSRMVISWARKRGAGAFRPAPDEFVSLAGSVGTGEEAHYRENVALARLLARYWHENPKRLARVLDELEIWLNVREEAPNPNITNNGGGGR
jgi:hypothetical protein